MGHYLSRKAKGGKAVSFLQHIRNRLIRARYSGAGETDNPDIGMCKPIEEDYHFLLPRWSVHPPDYQVQEDEAYLDVQVLGLGRYLLVVKKKDLILPGNWMG